jgi:hypothetical protein
MSVFSPDERNSGGRKAISSLMNSHYACLARIKPVINIGSLSRTYKPKSTTSTRRSMDFTEVKEAFKRTSRVSKLGKL